MKYTEIQLYATGVAFDEIRVARVLLPPVKSPPQVLLWHDNAYERRVGGRYYRIDALRVFTAEEHEALGLEKEIDVDG